MVPKSQIHGASQGHQYRKKLFSSHAARHDAADSMLMQSSRGEERTLKTLPSRLTTNGVHCVPLALELDAHLYGLSISLLPQPTTKKLVHGCFCPNNAVPSFSHILANIAAFFLGERSRQFTYTRFH